MGKIFKRTLATIMVVLMVLTSAPLGGFVGMEWDWLDTNVMAADDKSGDVVEFNGHYYKLFVDGTVPTWEDAALYCESMGGYIATISSKEENDFLFKYICSLGHSNAYFGYNDAKSEGSWYWKKDEGNKYTNWHRGEPNQSGNEDYAMFYYQFTDGTWNDGDFQGGSTANDELSFICEWENKADIIKLDSKKYSIKVVNSSGEPIEKAKVTVVRSGVNKEYTTNKNGYVSFEKGTISALDFTVTASGYEKYTTVGKNYQIGESGYEVVILYTKEEAGLKLSKAIYQDTNSSYKEVIGFDVNLIKETKRLSMSNASKGYFRIICSTSDNSKVNKFIIYQNKNIIQTSDDGTFKLKISHFKAGKNIYVVVIGKDGKKVATNLNLEMCDDSFAKEWSVSFGNKIAITVPDSIPFVGGSEVSCKIPDLPIRVELENGKLYAGLNYNFTEDKSIEEQYDELKTLMNDVKKLAGYKVGKNLKGNITKFLKKRDKFKLPVAGDVEAMLFGGGEITWSDKGLDGMSIQAYFLVDASLEKNWQTMVSVVPVTINIKVGIEGKLHASVVCNYKTETINGDVELNIKPYLNAFGGAGVGKYIGVGVYGDADVDFGIQLFGTTISPGLNYVDLTGEMGIKAYAGPLTYKKSFAHNTWHIYTRTDALSLTNYNYPEQELYYAGVFDSKNYDVDDVSYLENESEWLGEWSSDIALFSARTKSESMIDINTLVYNTYRNLQPALAASENNAVMAFIGADTDRGAQNIPVAMYSVYNSENSTWSEPVQFDKNQTADASPFVYSDGQIIYAAYQDANKEYDDNLREEDYMFSQSVSVAVFNNTKKKFVIEKTFKDETNYYRNPKITSIAGVPTLVWLSGSDVDILGQGNSHIMISQRINGSWTDPIKYYKNCKSVYDYAIGEFSGVLGLLKVIDYDNDYTTKEDRKLEFSQEKTTIYFDDIKYAENLAYAKLPSENEEGFIWTEKGYLYTLDNKHKAVQICDIGSPESVTIVNDKILFTGAGEGNSEIFAITYNKKSDSYGLPSQISQQDMYIERISGVSFDNKEILSMTRKTVEIKEDDVTDECEFAWAIINSGSSLKIDNVEYRYRDISNGKIPFYISVGNYGTDIAENYSVYITDSSNNTIACQNLKESLAAGCIEDVTINVPNNSISAVDEFTVYVKENDEIKDSYTLNFGYGDLAVYTEAVKVGDSNTLICTVSNEGLSKSSGDLFVYETSKDYSVMSEKIDNLLPGEKITFIVDLDGFEGERVLTSEVVPASDDYSETNNIETTYFDFEKFTESECQHKYVEDLTKKATCTKTGQKTYACVCGDTYTKTIAKLGHKYSSSFTVDKKATYTAEGSKSKHCTRSGCTAKTSVTVIEKLPLGTTSSITASKTNSSVTLSWKKVSGATGYRVYRKTSDGWKTLGHTTELTYTEKGLKANTKYTYAVKAYVLDGKTKIYAPKYKSVDVTTSMTSLGITSKITSTQTHSSVTLTWNKVTGATGYRVFQKVDGKWKTLTDTTKLTYTVNSLKANTKYDFAVRAYVLDGSTKVLASKYKSISVTTSKAPLGTTSKITTSVTSSTVKLNWNKVSGADGYRVFQKIDGKWKKLTDTTKLTYTVKSLKANTKYSFAVRAYELDDSTKVMALKYKSITATTSKASSAPGQVKNVKATPTATTVKLTWSKVSGVKGYEVFSYNSKTKKYTSLGKTTGTSYTVKKLKANTSYQYAVQAYNVSGKKTIYGKVSSVVKVTTLLAAPTLKVTSTKGKANLTWNNIAGETGYAIYMATSKNGKYTHLANYKANSTKATKSKLESGKTYYFKIRAYKKANGKTTYGAYSAVKSVKIK